MPPSCLRGRRKGAAHASVAGASSHLVAAAPPTPGYCIKLGGFSISEFGSWASLFSTVSKKSLPSRPSHDFTISSVRWDCDIVRNHTRAGFDPVPDLVVFRRFFQFLDFLQGHKLTVNTYAVSLAAVTVESSLMNSHLTEEGYRFVQYAQPRWSKRLYKDRGADKERAFLDRWLVNFRKQADGTGHQLLESSPRVLNVPCRVTLTKVKGQIPGGT